MPAFENIDHDHVIQALREHDDLGQDAFLDTYGFGPARDYVLEHEGRSYDSTAVLAAALRHATGTPATHGELSGSKERAAAALRELGFEVTGPRDAADVGTEVARDAWAQAAREVLLVTATRYQAVITQKEVAQQAQERAGITTSQQVHYWIGDVLTRVAVECDRREEPILSSLCVNASGSVGDTYAAAVEAVRGTRPDDPDSHAAKERLSCHRHFDASDLPSGGGYAVLVPTLQRSRDRERRTRLAEAPVLTCPTCHMALPKTGVCDNCG